MQTFVGWQRGTSYRPGEKVLHRGTVFVATSQVDGDVPPSADPDHWTPLTRSGSGAGPNPNVEQ